MPSSMLLILPLLLSTIPSTAALPFPSSPTQQPKYRYLQKRATKAHNVGIGFAITISLLIVFILVFYLGVRRGQAGSWFCWRSPVPSTDASPPPLETPVMVEQNSNMKSRISCPMPIHSSALPELDSPLEEPQRATPKALELSSDALSTRIHEMGEPSPKRSRFTMDRKSYYNRKSHVDTRSWLDRKSWFCRSAMQVESEQQPHQQQRGRSNIVERGAQEKLFDTDDASVKTGPPAYPGPAVLKDERVQGEAQGERERETSGMDWSGMEWLRRVYAERKSAYVGRKSAYAGRKSAYKSGF